MPHRLFLTGDTHRQVDVAKLSFQKFPTQKDLDRSDIMVVLGDWGVLWYGDERDNKWINNWDLKPWTTFVVYGNHDNYSALQKYPIVYKFGAAARKITDNIYIAESGNIYNLNGKRCLCINGADSVDRSIRTEGLNWWSEEAISSDVITQALHELEAYNFEIDYLFTHCGGTEVCTSLGFTPMPSEKQLQKLIDLGPKNDYVHYCGHYHLDQWINVNTRIVYQDIIEIR